MMKGFCHRYACVLGGICLFFATSCGPGLDLPPEVAARIPDQIDFNYHVKPILSDRCFACHGPDQQKLEADLRLDVEADAFKALGEKRDRYAIVRGSPRDSELIRRITSDDPEYLMPPRESNLVLSTLEIAILTKWIKQGAEYKEHWSFIPPARSSVPMVKSKKWPVNEIDHFVLARLEKEKLEPSLTSDKTKLLRRVYFDLTGLPPTLQEIDDFIQDESDSAYENVVDRLLRSRHYGERMAMDWMDVARYADSHGYHADGIRIMWPWRDWVIQSFNDNMPFDQFITWQLAGDLLPNATQEQVLATAFHRNNPTNSESGIVPEEYRLENVFDRTNTTAKAFLGLTMECARCHDHKFDPISQQEFYQFSTFFNNIDELGMTGNDGNFAPTLPLMTDRTAGILESLQQQIAKMEVRLAKYSEDIEPGEISDQSDIIPMQLAEGLEGYFPLDQLLQKNRFVNQASPDKVATIRGPRMGKGYRGQAPRFTNEYEHLTLEDLGNWERTDAFSMGAYVFAEKREAYSVIMGNAGGKNSHWRGYEMFLDSLNRVSVRITYELPDQCLQITTVDSIPVHTWKHVFFTYDGSSKAEGVKIFIGGRQAQTIIKHDRLFKSIRTINDTLELDARGIRVGRSFQGDLDLGLLQGSIDEIRVYDRLVSSLEVAKIAGVMDLLKSNPAWIDLQKEHFLLHHDESYQAMMADLHQLRLREFETLDTLIDIMVMREMDRPRQTYVLDRGVYDAPREAVDPGIIEKFLPWPENAPANRLGLARWILSEDHPLTSRVLVNRYWSMFFGAGIVGTLEDFGNQGDLPTHPALLDWLAKSFMESGWDLKALVRLMVTSASYQQSSLVPPGLYQRDPYNRLLARGPRQRLHAEMIRDNMLHASGLLVDKIGGPSVKTYQPDDLWSKTHFSRILTKYQPDEGDKLYRRSLYTFIRRTAPPPTMTVMDASDRSSCIVRRQKTSTPLQALLVLNEPQMIECCRVLAERVIREFPDQQIQQLNLAFRLLSSRRLTQEEQALMQQLYREELTKYEEDRAESLSLLNIGAYPIDFDLTPGRVAALTMVINTMANFDEVYTKG